MPSITMTIELDETFLYDVLTTAIESGAIAYWSVPSEINREVDTLQVISATLEDREWDINHGYHNCSELGCDEEPEFKHEGIDLDTIVNGIQKVLSGEVEVVDYIRGYIDRGVREMDAGDIDAEACDVIVQAAVFGKIVYG